MTKKNKGFKSVVVVAARSSTQSVSTSDHSDPADDFDNRQVAVNKKRSKVDIWLLGITIVIGGQYQAWNAGLVAGFYSYLIGYLLIAAAYIALCCCTAEITGALPFAGGAYGLARCTLGFFPGYLIGCCEALEYITYVAATTESLAKILILIVPSLHGYEPLIYLLFYLSALWFHIAGGNWFWRFTLTLGAASLAILLVFCFGCMSLSNFSAAYAVSDLEFAGGFSGFMKALPLAAWFFVGVEALSLANDDVYQPKVTVPHGQVTCVTTLTVTGILVMFVAVSLPYPGGMRALSEAAAPLDFGFTNVLKITYRSASAFTLPATYATAFGFIWCYGKLIHAMASSSLFPPVLARTSLRYGTPYVALVAGSMLSYAICLTVYYQPGIVKYLYPVCITAAFMSYTGQCIGYISLKKNYRNIKSSHFQNPFGIAGAVYSMVVWILGIISIAGFQEDHQVALITFIVIVILLAMFYRLYARKRQTFSRQENKVLLVAHVLKFNRRKAHPRKNIVACIHPHRTSETNRISVQNQESSRPDSSSFAS